MKYLILFLISTTASAECFNKTESTSWEDKIMSRVQQPKELEGAQIAVITKDGQVYTFPAEDYMVAKRVRLVKTVNTKNSLVRICDGKKNEVILGARRDHTGLSVATSPNTATVRSEKGLVLDATYIRKDLFKEGVGAGLGIDTNGTPKAVIGVEF